MLNRETERVASMLAQSLSGPQENSPESRIARFLAHRQRTLDKYEEFSYDSITRGVKRREKVEETPTSIDKSEIPHSEPNTTARDDSIEEFHDKLPNDTNDSSDENRIASKQRSTIVPTKRNTGKVAEYFGRT